MASIKASRRGGTFIGRAGGTRTPRGISEASGPRGGTSFAAEAAAGAGEAAAGAAEAAAGVAEEAVGAAAVDVAADMGGAETSNSHRLVFSGLGAVTAARARRQRPDIGSAPGVCRDSVTVGACLRARTGGCGRIIKKKA
jgi:hypothetical protein